MKRRHVCADDRITARHVVGVLWLALPEKWRWAWVNRTHRRHPERCWCDLVDCAMLADRKADYRAPWGGGCDVPVPWEVGEPESGRCYCPPREVTP